MFKLPVNFINKISRNKVNELENLFKFKILFNFLQKFDYEYFKIRII